MGICHRLCIANKGITHIIFVIYWIQKKNYFCNPFSNELIRNISIGILDRNRDNFSNVGRALIFRYAHGICLYHPPK